MAAARGCARPVAAADPGAQEDRLPGADRSMAARTDAGVSPGSPGRQPVAHRAVLPTGAATAGARRTSRRARQSRKAALVAAQFRAVVPALRCPMNGSLA